MSLLYKLQKRDKYKTRIGCPVPYCKGKKGSWWTCYNCGDEAIEFMAKKGYDVWDLSGPYISDIINQNVMWVKAIKMKN